MPKLTNEKKVEAIKDFLKENNISYEENHFSKKCGVVIPLAVMQHRIAIRIGDSNDFYIRTRGKYYPIFIRDKDTKSKVLEKITNTIIKSMTNKQNAQLRRKYEKQEFL